MENGKYLEIDFNTPIIIYGAASNGMKGYASLHGKNNYNVIGFIDKRASEISEQYGLPVWDPEGSFLLPKETCVVCICIKNVFEHEFIVSDLIQKGFRYFIFKPIRGLARGEEIFEAINRNYESIFGDDKQGQRYTLEAVPELQHLRIHDFRDAARMIDEKDTVVAAIPFESLFFDAYDWKDCLKAGDGIANVASLVPQIDLFSFFNGDHGDIASYLNHCAATIANSQKRYGEGGGKIKDTPAWRNSILSNRRTVFAQMNESLEVRFNFFIENAPICMLDDKDRVVMKSSKHRVAFFIVKKRKFIPVRLPRQDYEKLLRISEVDELKACLEKRGVHYAEVPINHPYFYEFPCDRDNFFELFAYPSMREISRAIGGEKPTESVAVCDALGLQGAMSRYLSRAGFAARTVLKNEEEADLCKRLDALMNVRGIKYVSCIAPADILFMEYDPQTNAVIPGGVQLLFILTGCCEPPAIAGFQLKQKICETFWKGKRACGFFYTSK